ncbi:cellulose biosynthesis protein BcsD [Caulobacter segnis]|jgi:hypothetical protein|uniref:cellulose biosynthesis protein BcsD n=1 Tax=Caulobacter segnis TaxID=88688 RepID=UPI001CBADEE1|nr:cellulose biosynthesis protein BcsD [Caulobacter segnis]UAL09291.1 hypothetical protein K8940_16060 [Caulobacter segnis]
MLKSLSSRGAPEAPKTDTAELRYLAARQFSPQWRTVLVAMADELFENFSAEEAWGFYRQIGLRVSGEVALPSVKTLEELEASLNKVLAELDWGFVALSLDDSAISIRHRAYPGLHMEDQSGHWRRAFAAILEGVYTIWLQTQGGRPEMKATYRDSGGDDALDFSYGL